MTLVRFRPFNDVPTFQDEMNRMFDEVWRRHRQSPAAGSWYPAVDIKENESEFTMVAELPGLERNDVKISLQDNVLVLRGEKKAQSEEKNENWHQVERAYGAFERSFYLSNKVDPEKVKAEFKNGILTVTLPKVDSARPREIDIA